MRGIRVIATHPEDCLHCKKATRSPADVKPIREWVDNGDVMERVVQPPQSNAQLLTQNTPSEPRFPFLSSLPSYFLTTCAPSQF
jgi:hypothetical protein